MGVRQRYVKPFVGSVSTMPVSRYTANRCGLSHCGQSSAWSVVEPNVSVASRIAKNPHRQRGRRFAAAIHAVRRFLEIFRLGGGDVQEGLRVEVHEREHWT